MYEDIQRLRDYPIHLLVGSEEAGRRIKICCPFHNERTPSCNIYPDNSFYCFGCGKSGQNAIDFVKELGYEFREAKEYLEKLI